MYKACKAMQEQIEIHNSLEGKITQSSGHLLMKDLRIFLLDLGFKQMLLKKALGATGGIIERVVERIFSQPQDSIGMEFGASSNRDPSTSDQALPDEEVAC